MPLKPPTPKMRVFVDIDEDLKSTGAFQEDERYTKNVPLMNFHFVYEDFKEGEEDDSDLTNLLKKTRMGGEEELEESIIRGEESTRIDEAKVEGVFGRGKMKAQLHSSHAFSIVSEGDLSYVKEEELGHSVIDFVLQGWKPSNMVEFSERMKEVSVHKESTLEVVNKVFPKYRGRSHIIFEYAMQAFYERFGNSRFSSSVRRFFRNYFKTSKLKPSKSGIAAMHIDGTMYLNFENGLYYAMVEYLAAGEGHYANFFEAYMYFVWFNIYHELKHLDNLDMFEVGKLDKSAYSKRDHDEMNVILDVFINTEIIREMKNNFLFTKQGAENPRIPTIVLGRQEIFYTGVWDDSFDGKFPKDVIQVFKRYFSTHALYKKEPIKVNIVEEPFSFEPLIGGAKVIVHVEYGENLTMYFDSSFAFGELMYKFLNDVLSDVKKFNNKDKEKKKPPPPPKDKFEKGDKVKVKATGAVGVVYDIIGEVISKIYVKGENIDKRHPFSSDDLILLLPPLPKESPPGGGGGEPPQEIRDIETEREPTQWEVGDLVWDKEVGKLGRIIEINKETGKGKMEDVGSLKGEK